MTLNHNAVFEQAMEAMGITLPELLKRDRRQHVIEKRAVIAWLLRHTGLSYPAIGEMLKRDHVSAMSLVRKVEGDPRLASEAHKILTSMS